jgi:predicted nucleic acid-binding Zn ribbon protein
MGRPAVGSLGVLSAAWGDLVGPSLAGHSSVVGLTPEVVVVSCDHPARATQLRALAPTILSRATELTGWSPARVEVRVRRSSGGTGDVG